MEVVSEFNRLSELWKNETIFMSSRLEAEENQYYKEILNLGSDIIPCIINELKTSPYWWFSALETLTGEQPLNKSDFGDLLAMTNAWLEWDKNKNGNDCTNFEATNSNHEGKRCDSN